MRFGKVADEKIVNWLDIDPSDTLKIQKATAHGYRPEENVRPTCTEYERVVAVGTTPFDGHDIQPGKLVKLYQVVARSQEEIAAINLTNQKSEAVAASLPSWTTTETAIRNAFPDAAQQNVILKLAKACYVHIKNSLV